MNHLSRHSNTRPTRIIYLSKHSTSKMKLSPQFYRLFTALYCASVAFGARTPLASHNSSIAHGSFANSSAQDPLRLAYTQSTHWPIHQQPGWSYPEQQCRADSRPRRGARALLRDSVLFAWNSGAKFAPNISPLSGNFKRGVSATRSKLGDLRARGGRLSQRSLVCLLCFLSGSNVF
jgi:hypothetical protein